MTWRWNTKNYELPLLIMTTDFESILTMIWYRYRHLNYSLIMSSKKSTVLIVGQLNL